MNATIQPARRLYVKFTGPQAMALSTMAKEDMRDMKQQMQWLVEQEAKRRNLKEVQRERV